MTAVRLLCLVAIATMAVGCSPSPAAAPTGVPQPVVQTNATATPLAVEQQATPKSGNYYQPPGWDGVSDVNCKDFDSHAHAMSFFRGTGGSTSNDPYGMDGDHDGNACETLP
jgi:micrococcal nuclease